jgi:GNAT superfamily N-acetyltransferase
MGFVPTDESTPDRKVKSIFCFAIAPDMRRHGIARLLLERVCQDAAQDGFDLVEAYPFKEFVSEAEDFVGPAELYRKSGFTVHYEAEQKLVMRRQLK